MVDLWEALKKSRLLWADVGIGPYTILTIKELCQLFENSQQQAGAQLRRSGEADHAPQGQQTEKCGQVEI